MKVIEKNIWDFQEKLFFVPIRSKLDFIRVLLYSARHLFIGYDSSPESTVKLQLVIDKMSRLFYFKDGKYFSIAFPFQVLFDEHNNLSIATRKGTLIDSKSISEIISIVNDINFQLNPSLIDLYICPGDFSSNGIFLLEELIQLEPSYIRFDEDSENESGVMHPLFHLDINYSSYGTYKLGLQDRISREYFVDIQNVSTKCSFVVNKL